MSTLIQDLRYALRTLARSPGFAAAAVATLALGIGANAAIFSVLHAVMWKPMPYERPDELVRITGTYTGQGVVVPQTNISPLDALDWRAQCRSLSGVAVYTNGSVALTGSGEPLRLRNGVASTNLLSVLGVRPVLGRDFSPDDEVEGHHRVALLAHGFWQRRFGGDPGVVGQTITLAGNPYLVVGVLPAGFRSPIPAAGMEPDLWRPFVFPKDPGARGGHFLLAVARLTPGASLGEARKEMELVTSRLRHEYPKTNTGWSTQLEDLHRSAARESRSTLLTLEAAVGSVLAIACANIAGLLLCRAASRRREMAIRRALGAGTSRLVRQLLVESLVISAAAAVLGWLLALWARDAIAPLGAASFSEASAFEPAVIAFTAILALLTSLAFGLVPALFAAALDPQATLKEGPGSSAPPAVRARQFLVAGEVAIAVMLLTAAGLFARSLRFLLAEEPGFQPGGVATFSFALPAARYATPESQILFHRELAGRLAALPRVQAVGSINALPLAGGYSCDTFALADRPAPPEGSEPCAESRVVGGDYFVAMKIPLKEGRFFTREDTRTAPRVAIVNETFARTWWPGRSALGQRVRWGDWNGDANWLNVVGVVGDVRHFGLGEPVRPEIATPYDQTPSNGMGVVVRVDRAPSAVAPAARSVVAALDKDLPLYDARTMDEWLGRSVTRPRQRAGLTGIFAGAALLLAALGVFGTVAFSVVSRTREIGIRMALGAGRSQILSRVLGQGLRPVVAGAALGLAAAAAGARLLSGLLYRVPATDPLVFAAVPAALLAVAALAAYLPARRAAAVDPMVALRSE
jgi:predicted permease